MTRLLVDGSGNLLVGAGGGFIPEIAVNATFTPVVQLALAIVGDNVQAVLGPVPENAVGYLVTLVGVIASVEVKHTFSIRPEPGQDTIMEGTRDLGLATSVFGPFATEPYDRIIVAIRDVNENLSPVGRIRAEAGAPASPGIIPFTAGPGSDPGEVDLVVTALPSAGDSTTAGDGLGGALTVEVIRDGGDPVSLGALSVTTYTVTGLIPGQPYVFALRAVSSFRAGPPSPTAEATAKPQPPLEPPVFIEGSMPPLSLEGGEAFVADWTTKFTGADSFDVTVGLTGGVESGTGNKDYTVASLTVEDVVLQVAATNAGGTTTATWTISVVDPGVAASLISAIPDVVVQTGSTVDYDLTQHFAGTDLVYSGTGLPSPFQVTAAGRLRNTAPLTSAVATVSVTISADNAVGPAASDTISIGVTATPPAALAAGDIVVFDAINRYTGWRTPRVTFPNHTPANWFAIDWSRSTPDANGVIPANQIERDVVLSGGYYQIHMADEAKDVDPTGVSPRVNYAVQATGVAWTNLRFRYQETAGGLPSAWSQPVTVPEVVVVVPASVKSRQLVVRTQGNYTANAVDSPGMQFQHVQCEDEGVVDAELIGTMFFGQDENSVTYIRGKELRDKNTPARMTPLRCFGLTAAKMAGAYANSDDDKVMFVGGNGYGKTQGGAFEGPFPTGDRCFVQRHRTMDGTREAFVNIAQGASMSVNQNCIHRRPNNGYRVTLGANPLAFTNGSPTITVTRTAHGLTAGRDVVIEGAAAAAGLTISGPFEVQTVPNANTFTITAASNANATVSGGGSGVALVALGSLTNAQRPIFVVENVKNPLGGANPDNIIAVHVWRSTTGSLAGLQKVFTFTTANVVGTKEGKSGTDTIEGMFRVQVAPNGDVAASGRKGVWLCTNPTAAVGTLTFSNKYSGYVRGFAFDPASGGESSVSGAAIGLGAAPWGVLTTTNIRNNAFEKPVGQNLPANFKCSHVSWMHGKIWAVSGYDSDGAHVSTNAGTSFSPVTSQATPSPYAGFVYNWNSRQCAIYPCRADSSIAIGHVNQTISRSINGGTTFKGSELIYFDHAHSRGLVYAKSDASVFGFVQQDRSYQLSRNGGLGFSASGVTKGLVIGPNGKTLGQYFDDAGVGGPVTSGSCGLIVGAGLTRSIVLLTGATGGTRRIPVVIEPDGNDSFGKVTVFTAVGYSRGKRSRFHPTNNEWGFLGKWLVKNMDATSPASITFTSFSNREFVGVQNVGGVVRSFWIASGEHPTQIYRSENADASSQTLWATVPAFFDAAICVDPFVANRLLYVRRDTMRLRELKEVDGDVQDNPLYDFAPLILSGLEDAGVDINASGWVAPEAGGGWLVADENKAGIFYLGTDDTVGIPCIFRTTDNGVTGVDATGTAPLTAYSHFTHPLTGDLLSGGSMGTYDLAPPTGVNYPTLGGNAGKIGATLQTFYDRADIPDEPVG